MSAELRVTDLGRCPYQPVVDLQERLVSQRRSGDVPDTLLLVEHEPVYTLGRNASDSHVLASADELSRRGAALVRSSRGGDVTYHGPGQIVGYPIVMLRGDGAGPAWYVARLEDVIVRALSEFGVEARGDPSARGVWVGSEKIAAIGVRISSRVTMHGFALNVSTDLEAYGAIVPCGLRDRGVTSLRRHSDVTRPSEVKPVLVESFCRVFGYDRVSWVSAEDVGWKAP